MAEWGKRIFSGLVEVKVYRLQMCSTQLFGRWSPWFQWSSTNRGFAEVREGSHTILPRFTNLPDPDLLWDVNLHYDVSNDAELEGRTQVIFFQDLFQKLKTKETLEVAHRNELNWKIIFNHIAEASAEQGHRKRPERYSWLKLL